MPYRDFERTAPRVFANFALFCALSFGASDTTPPQLLTVRLSALSVDTSQGAAWVPILFTGTDDLSGISTVLFGFKGPDGDTRYTDKVTLMGTATSFAGTATLTLPKYTDPGAWTLFEVKLSDRAGNRKTLSTSEIRALIGSNVLHVSSVVDKIPPELDQAQISPRNVDTTNGPAKVTLTFRGSDDNTGVEAVTASLRSPSGNIIFSSQTTFVTPNGNKKEDRVFQGTTVFNIPQFAETGQWTLSSMTAKDGAGNLTTLSQNDVTRLAGQSVVNVTSKVDSEPPRLSALSFSPRAVATSGAPATVTVNFSGTDNLSGFAHIMVGFRSPSGNFIHNDIVRLSGPPTQFSGSTILSFPQFVETGVWVLADVRLIDQAGNVGRLGPNDIAALTNGALSVNVQ